MKTMILALSVVAIVGATGAPDVASARDVTIVGPEGRVVTRSAVREPGSVQSSTILPNGGVVTRGVTRTREGTSGVVVGPRGRSFTRDVTR